jgi:hypothetical protein
MKEYALFTLFRHRGLTLLAGQADVHPGTPVPSRRYLTVPRACIRLSTMVLVVFLRPRPYFGWYERKSRRLLSPCILFHPWQTENVVIGHSLVAVFASRLVETAGISFERALRRAKGPWEFKPIGSDGLRVAEVQK